MSSRCLDRVGMMLALGIAVLTAACEREERDTQSVPEEETTISSVALSPLQPGEASAPPGGEHRSVEQNAFNLSQGKQLYTWFNCNGCHAHGGGDIGPALMDDKWIYGSQPDQIFATIVEGRPNGMPAFHGKLPDYQVWQLAAYVRSLSGNVAKDAAPGRSDDMQMKEPENTKKQEKPKDLNAPK